MSFLILYFLLKLKNQRTDNIEDNKKEWGSSKTVFISFQILLLSFQK